MINAFRIGTECFLLLEARNIVELAQWFVSISIIPKLRAWYTGKRHTDAPTLEGRKEIR